METNPETKSPEIKSEPSKEVKKCCTCGYSEGISRIIVSLVCLIAAVYFYQIPNVLSATIPEFQRGLLTAAFIFVGLIAAHPVLVKLSKKE